jgi:ABC-type antimicrobial peptide transport system permease subunit
LRQGLGIGLSGAVAGVLLTLGTARFVQPLLFQVSASDPVLLASAAAIVLSVSLLASYVPTRRLRRFAPAVVLRVE